MEEKQVNESKIVNQVSLQTPISTITTIGKLNILNNRSIRSNNTDINILNELNKCLQQESNFSNYFDNKDTNKQREVYKEFPNIIKPHNDDFIHNVIFNENKTSSKNSKLDDSISRIKESHEFKANKSSSSNNKNKTVVNNTPIDQKLKEVNAKISKLSNNSTSTHNSSKNTNNKSNNGCFSWCSSN
jgi:hypothetical protein